MAKKRRSTAKDIARSVKVKQAVAKARDARQRGIRAQSMDHVETPVAEHLVIEGDPRFMSGTPVITIDEQALEVAAGTHMSFEHLATIFGVKAAALEFHPYYRPIIDRARAKKVQALLEAQFETAITDRNSQMQVWLGKNYAGQRDVTRVETTGADGKPQEHVVTRRVVTAVIPDNGRDTAPALVAPAQDVMTGQQARSPEEA